MQNKQSKKRSDAVDATTSSPSRRSMLAVSLCERDQAWKRKRKAEE